MTDQICKKCKKRPIYVEHSSKYCFRCYETRQQANKRYNESHRKENCERTKNWVKAHPEKIREYGKRARLNPYSTARFSAKEWKQSRAGKEAARRYYENNRLKISEYAKKYVKDNLEKTKRRIAKWSSENREKVSGYVKKYRGLHPEQVNKSSKKRREIFKGVSGDFTLAEWVSLCEKHGNKCLWCKRTDRKLTIDHVVPITKGGTNSIENIQPLCQSCNSRKRNRTIDFRTFGSAIMEWT